MELRTLALIILVYLIVSICYVIVRATLFPKLGNCITMFDWPFMAIAPPMAMYAIATIDKNMERAEGFGDKYCQSPCERWIPRAADGGGRGCVQTFGDTGALRPVPRTCNVPVDVYGGQQFGLPLGDLETTDTDRDIYNFAHKAVIGSADSFSAQKPYACPAPCAPDYKYMDKNEREWRRRTSGVAGGPSPMSFSPEELGRNFRETERFLYGKGMVEVDDFHAREQLKRSRSRRDSKLGAYYQQARLHDLYYRDESYRNMDGLPNGSPYDPEWWDNDIRL